MPTTARPAVTRFSSGAMAWEMARRVPHPALGGWVQGYCGYVERCAGPVRRREPPRAVVPLIISFGDPIDVVVDGGTVTHTSFTAGLDERSTLTEHSGRQHGIQVNLTPLGAYRLLGVPMHELTGMAVDLAALGMSGLGGERLGGSGLDGLADRLASASGWEERFALLDRLLLTWLADGPHVDPAVAWAWRRLDRTGGTVPVSDLAAEIGWSRRHLAARFRTQVGLAPKPVAQLLRFGRAVDLLGAGSATSIGDVAAACGYADHSHLVREFRRLAGCTPSAFLAALDPSFPGVPADG